MDGKVETRELAEEQLGGFVVGERGLSFREERTNICASFVDRDFALEPVLNLSHAFEEAKGREPTAVLIVLCPSANPKIFSTVIQPVAVAVIGEEVFRNDNNFPVHTDAHLPSEANADSPHGVDRTAHIDMGVPLEGVHPLEVLLVDDSEEPLGQADELGAWRRIGEAARCVIDELIERRAHLPHNRCDEPPQRAPQGSREDETEDDGVRRDSALHRSEHLRANQNYRPNDQCECKDRDSNVGDAFPA